MVRRQVRRLINGSVLNFTISEPIQSAPRVITTEDLLAVCGSMDAQILWAAILGLVLALGTLVYLRRLRSRLGASEQLFADKLLLAMIAMAFVVVIVKVVRGG